MTTVAAWLESRRPPPPEALARRVHDALGPDAGRDVSEATEALLAAAQRLAATVLGDGDGGRGTASDLLAVDALVTFAFEAAAADPARLVDRAERAMRDLARLAAVVP